jgi:hypothetical protein
MYSSLYFVIAASQLDDATAHLEPGPAAKKVLGHLRRSAPSIECASGDKADVCCKTMHGELRATARHIESSQAAWCEEPAFCRTNAHAGNCT